MKGRPKIEVTEELLAKYGHTRESYEKLGKSGRWSVRNKEKHRLACKQTRKNKPEYYRHKRRQYGLKQSYNLTLEQYDEMLKQQNGCCAICGTDKPTGKWSSFAVDHNHTTGEVRGLLCNECNRGIGYLKDSPELLIKASEYLLSYNRKTKLEKDESGKQKNL